MKNIYLQSVPVAGTDHVPRSAYPVAQLEIGDTVELELDGNNEHDSNAIGVWAYGTRIGWVPQLANKVLARMLEGDLHLYGTVCSFDKFGSAVWIDVMWQREETEREKAEEVLDHAKKRRPRNPRV